jgi:hypothetical protein
MRLTKRVMLVLGVLGMLAGTGCHGRRMLCRDSDSSSYDACR